MNQINQQRQSAFEVAKELLESRFRGAEVVFAAGSIRRNEATATSDIDLVVVYPKLENAYRESFNFKGWPIEAFVHDPETLNYFFWEVDAKNAIPSLPYMVVEGLAIPESHPLVSRLKSLADRVLDKGPSKYSDEQFKNLRYQISDLLDDLRSPRNDFELIAIIGKFHEMLGDFWFRAQGRWSASGKHIPRRMQKLDPIFSKEWVQAFNAALLGNTKELIALTENVLSKYGGYIFDGYRRDAPAEWRKSLPLPKDFTKDFSLAEVTSGLWPEESIYSHTNLGEIHIRLVTIADVKNLRLLLNSAYKKLSDQGMNFNATFQDEELTAEGLGIGRTFVLYRKAQLIGTLKITNQNDLNDRPCLYVSRFAVLPELQGNGIGLFLLKLAEKIAQREGFVCIQLDTAQPAEHLLKFYQAYGFKIIRPIYYEGKTYCSWVLEKPIEKI